MISIRGFESGLQRSIEFILNIYRFSIFKEINLKFNKSSELFLSFKSILKSIQKVI